MKKISFITVVISIIGLAAIAAISYVSWKEAKRDKGIDQEIEALKQEAETIQSNNRDLREKISYFETPEFQEKIAKEKLNLQKPEEQVVIVKPSLSLEGKKEASKSNDTNNASEEIPNYKKWRDQFFKY